MRLVVRHDFSWDAHRACHEKATECVTKSKAAPTAGAAVGRCSPPFAERDMQELVQGPRRLFQAPPGPSESESRETNAFAPTASVQASREPWARAVGDELRRIVALTIPKRARSPYHDVRGVAAGRCVLADRTSIVWLDEQSEQLARSDRQTDNFVENTQPPLTNNNNTAAALYCRWCRSSLTNCSELALRTYQQRACVLERRARGGLLSPSMTLRALSLVVLALAARPATGAGGASGAGGADGATGAGATEVNGDMAILELKRLQERACPTPRPYA